MGITYAVDAEAGVVLERWTGKITATDVAAHWSSMVSDVRVTSCSVDMADIRECEIEFSGEAMRQLVETILEPVFRGRHLKLAVLVQAAVQFGVARQHRAFSGTFAEVAVFTDELEAREWILSQSGPSEAARR